MGKNTIVSLVITVAAVIVAVIHIAYPGLSIDQVIIGLGILAILPWLAYLFKSVKLPGGYELVFQDIQRQVIEAKGVAQEAKGAAADAGQLAQAAFSGTNANLATAESAALRSQAEGASAEAESWQTLAGRYNEIRKNQKSGAARTEAMTELVTEMLADAPGWKNFDVRKALGEADRGIRLAAYASLYKLPKFDLLGELINSVTRVEDKPFGQYWGIKSIGKVIGNRKEHDLSPQLVAQLEQFHLTKLHAGTDRYHALSSVLRDLKDV
jgi:hypothetical protein